MERRYCAWCGHRLRRDTVEQDGRPYHEICAAMRELGIKPEPEPPYQWEPPRLRD